MKQANTEIRYAAESAGVRLWQIADALGLADCNFSRKLRNELAEDERQEVLGIIRRLAKEANE